MDKRLGYHGDIRHKGTPEHDEMCMFVHDNFDSIIKLVLIKKGDYEEAIKYEKLMSTRPSFEVPVKFQKNSYNKEEVIGYIDIQTNVLIKDTGSSNNDLEDWYYDQENNVLIKPVNFEIKPRIDSFGDVVRQINYYKEYATLDNEQWVVITKTSGLKKYFNSQDIILFEYEELKKDIKDLEERERKKQEEIERVARERKERLERRWKATKNFVFRLFRDKNPQRYESSYHCLECGRLIKHKGKCLACNIKAKKNTK